MRYLLSVLLLLSSFIPSRPEYKGPGRGIAGALVKVRSLGSSYKGKYIAVEEYGFLPGNIPYARIRVIDVWTDREMEDLEIKAPKSNFSLQQIREKTLVQARDKALKYKIHF